MRMRRVESRDARAAADAVGVDRDFERGRTAEVGRQIVCHVGGKEEKVWPARGGGWRVMKVRASPQRRRWVLWCEDGQSEGRGRRRMLGPGWHGGQWAADRRGRRAGWRGVGGRAMVWNGGVESWCRGDVLDVDGGNPDNLAQSAGMPIDEAGWTGRR